ncbi:hypothetical protein [Bradyrhizobium sp. WSM3983]|uniref:hypothetical protein n=1 Tax=Bradyrhizobium sp. WSM3983 TaxID=1038867 RepID=UPI000421285F|nr:hypothetical protein [Bradyrhizobium sp. WSM3983]
MTLRWLSAGLGAGLGLVILALLILGVVTTSSAQQTPPQPHQASPQQQPAPKPANIDRNGVLMLIRSTLLALDQANKTGNYTVLRDLGAPGFQINTAARLAEIFAKQRGDKLDLSGVAVIDPQLSLLPQIEPNGLLHMAGFFPSVPSQVNFELLFAPVEGQWRVFGVSLSVGQSAPVAPAAPEAAPGKAVVSQKQASPPKPSVPSK